MSDYDQELMELTSVLSNSVYRKGKDARLNEVEKHYPGRFEMLDSDAHQATYKDKESGKIFHAISGTDITNEKGKKIKDLATDALVSLGLEKLGSRYKGSDKKVKKLVEEHGKDNVILTGHSLGGTITSDLSHKYGLEAHSFNRGGTHATFISNKFKNLHPKYREQKEKNHVYYIKPSLSGVDLLSIGTVIDPLANHHWVEPKKLKKSEKGVLESHSIFQFTPNKKK